MSSQEKIHRLVWLRSPLLIYLLLALFTRLWLIYHSNGLIDGDEAQIGIQALHILKGERPVYFYGQPYMGSLVAYILAGIFALFGASFWTLRGESLLLSLALVWLTWKLASMLATRANLTPTMHRWFVNISALVAALPPLYDAVLEMRVWGGYIETFAFSLLLLYWALRLVQRWKQHISPLESALRWIGIGLIVGLGLWVDALIVIPIITVAIWISGYCIIRCLRARAEAGVWPAIRPLLRGLPLSICAIPGALVGFAPALYWGRYHNWDNIWYLLHPGENVPMPAAVLQNYPTPLSQAKGVFGNFLTCDAPRVISGITPNVPVQPYKSLALLLHPASLNIFFYELTLIIVSFCIFFSAGLVVLSFFRKSQILSSIRAVLLLPLLFSAIAIAVYCLSDRTAKSLLDVCDQNSTGRYIAILVLVLPFLVATTLMALAMFISSISRQHRPYQGVSIVWGESRVRGRSPLPEREVPSHPPFSRSPLKDAEPVQKRGSSWISGRKLIDTLPKLIPLLLLMVYLISQGLAYVQVPAYQYFRSPFCKPALTHPGEVIAYLQKEHIRYVWASIYIGHVLSFDTHEGIIGAYSVSVDRIPDYTDAVQQARVASIIFFAQSNDEYPQIQKDLDKQHVRYNIARFHEDPGIDLVVITPENRNIKVATVSYAYVQALGVWTFGCWA